LPKNLPFLQNLLGGKPYEVVWVRLRLDNEVSDLTIAIFVLGIVLYKVKALTEVNVLWGLLRLRFVESENLPAVLQKLPAKGKRSKLKRGS
jgi:hypothetical protein